jgi:hypothetical protein
MPEFAKNPADLVKIAVIGWAMIKVINMGLRSVGLASYTTKGS